MTQITTTVITHLEPGILESEVKWALESITTNKASGGDEIPAELFQDLKDDAVKVLYLIWQQIWKPQQWPKDCKRSVFIPIPKKGNAKECSNYCTISLISHASKVMLKILQVRLQQYVNQELPDVQAGFKKKAEEAEIKLPTSIWSSKKQEPSRKTSTSALMTMPKPLTMLITMICGKFLKRWECQTTLTASWEICMQVKKQQLEPDMEQQTFQTGKGVQQGYIMSPCLFNLYAEYIMQNAGLDEAQGGIKIARRNINNLRYTDDTTLTAESEEEMKSLWMKMKEEREKAVLILNIQKTKIMASGPITSWQTYGGNNGNSDRLYFLGLQNHCRWWLQPWN